MQIIRQTYFFLPYCSCLFCINEFVVECNDGGCSTVYSLAYISSYVVPNYRKVKTEQEALPTVWQALLRLPLNARRRCCASILGWGIDLGVALSWLGDQ